MAYVYLKRGKLAVLGLRHISDTVAPCLGIAILGGALARRVRQGVSRQSSVLYAKAKRQ